MEDERLSLLDALYATKSSISILTTYSIDFQFYEAVVLRRLNAAGCERHLLLVDAERCGEALADPDTRPRLAGISYVLLPVPMGGAFHPKLLISLGKKSSSLFVGSHNLTYPGFGGNAEITNAVAAAAKSSAEAALVVQALDAVRSWAGADAGDLVAEVLAAARGLVGAARGSTSDVLLYSASGRPSLWKQLQPHLLEKPARVTLVGPFFDPKMDFVRRLVTDVGPKELIVAVDPSYSKIDRGVAKSTPARFVDATAVLAERCFAPSAALHAKAILIEGGGRRTLVTGSANPSAASWLSADMNAEAVLVRHDIDDAALATLGLGDLAAAPEITEAQWSQIAERVDAEADGDDVPAPRDALVAAHDEGVIRIRTALRPETVRLIFLDGTSETITPAYEDGHLVVRADEGNLARCVVVELLGERPTFAIVNHVSVLSRKSERGSSASADLRGALARVSDDPACIEEVLKLVERAIDEVDASDVATAGRAAPAPSAPDGAGAQPLGSRSMSLEDLRRRKGRPKALATGDVGAVIDMLIRRLGEGLSSLAGPEPPTKPPEVEEKDLDPIEEAARVAAATFDASALLKACHRKVRTMVKRMVQRIDTVVSSETGATRATIQLAAVCGVLRWLRRVEPRLEWLPLGESLIPAAAREELFWAAAGALALARPSLADLVRSETDVECEELSIATGLTAWLGRETGTDLRALPRHPDEDELDEFQWAGLLALLLRHVVVDEVALTQLNTAVGETRGRDREGWLAHHLRVGEAAAFAELDPSLAPVLNREARRGDLVRVGMRNGATGISFVIDLDGTKVRLLDNENEHGRAVLQNYVAVLALR